MKVDDSLTGVLVPGVLAGVIYLVIAVATGASAASSIIGGLMVAAIAVAIGLTFRDVYKHFR